MGGPLGQWAHQYDVPPRTHRVVREVWLPRATNIQAAYVDYVPFLFSLATFFLCEDNKPIDLVILYCVVMPFNQETRDSFLSYRFSPFQPR